ncbi:MAG: hypothetical protein HY747_01290 [Elusimicrobia bacterium]|nr:hypothetical protein [Elusimicrobiota bacterium]
MQYFSLNQVKKDLIKREILMARQGRKLKYIALTIGIFFLTGCTTYYVKTELKKARKRIRRVEPQQETSGMFSSFGLAGTDDSD